MPTEQSYPMATTVKHVSLNGIVFHPTSIDREYTKHGNYRRMEDGTLRFYYRGDYSRWTLKWEGLHESELHQYSDSKIEDIEFLATTFNYVDEFGLTFEVAILPDAMKTTVAAGTISTFGNMFYDVELTFEQVNPDYHGGGV